MGILDGILHPRRLRRRLVDRYFAGKVPREVFLADPIIAAIIAENPKITWAEGKKQFLAKLAAEAV